MANTQVRSKVVTAFKINGLSLRSEASKLLVEVLSEVDHNELDGWLERIIDCVQKQPLKTSFVDRDVVEIAINECNQEGDEEGDKIFNIVDVFKLPRFIYNSERKKFIPNPNQKACLHGTFDDKINMFVERYNILHQRALHHDLFMPATVAATGSGKSSKFSLKPVEHLLGCSGSLGDIIVLGMLAHLKEGKYFLEDPTGAVELNLTKAVFHSGLFTENCFVLAEGSYDDQVFHVTALGFPPCESAQMTRSYFGSINFFGGPSTTCVASSEKLKKIEQDEENQNNMFVFLSDLWLDQPKVLNKFKVLLSGYSQMPPALFVICGNFLSQPYGSKHLSVLRKCFQDLGDIVAEFTSLIETSRFVFIPGPQDPGPGNILPRPPLSKLLTEEIREKIPFAQFATNPCRIQYCTQEIVIFREDIINKMCRNSIYLPSDIQNIPDHFVKSILSQAHLCPLPLNIRPTYWAFDNALRLYPLPDLVVCADKYDGYNITNSDTICMNPGSFSRNEFCFKVYWPASKEVEDCKINT
ncbi:DNA polymerase epsilon subunit 2-like [Hydractinia symbiolongicarpus]|uniref:DNA polymerase epsilon subunit 2-like n=1 Tax=Hydractinia symbiolongicarpus TaxID=13093 RepID=UPI00254AF63C|nr:DNA polymerase epsilon subunit 2-like [Hydractinia symbiolongicarpus]